MTRRRPDIARLSPPGTGGRPGDDLGAALRASWALHGDQVFLRPVGQAPLSYDAVDRRAQGFAAALVEFGVSAGDRVVVAVPKSTDAVALYLACLQIGAIFVPVNPALPAPELAYLIADADPVLTVLDPQADPGCNAAVSTGATTTLGIVGDGDLATIADNAAPLEPSPLGNTEHAAAMLYTSGTTGRPKGALLTHRGLIANGRALVEAWGFTSDDVLVHCLPIFHVHGLFVALHSAILTASEVRFLPRFEVGDVLTALDGASVFMGVPTHYGRLLDDPRFDADSCRSLRLFTSGSAPMTEQMHRRFQQRTSHRIVERYGMTEAGIITSNPLDGERIGGTVGFALANMEVRIATEAGDAEPGEKGVVEIRGVHLFAGYRGQPERTAECHREDGFFVTGDIGSLDEQGRLTLEGRAGDMIISGGENVYPKELELTLDEHPAVIESAVVGLPHPDLGEAVVAFVLVGPDAGDPAELTAQLAASLEGRLARFKHPRAYIVVSELPRNAMGKVQKSLLRAASTDHFGR